MLLDHLLSKELTRPVGRQDVGFVVDLPQAGSNDILIDACIRTEIDTSGRDPMEIEPKGCPSLLCRGIDRIPETSRPPAERIGEGL